MKSIIKIGVMQKMSFKLLLLLNVFLLFASFKSNESPIEIGEGNGSNIFIDSENNVHIVFCKGDSLFYTSSSDGANSFTSPSLIGYHEGINSSISRGASITSTRDFLVVAATTKSGDIIVWKGSKPEGEWVKSGPINDVPKVAKEGFVSVSGGEGNFIYAVWNDSRGGEGVKLYGAVSADGGLGWSENILIYQSPEKTICECCKPNIIADSKGNVHVMFRNNLKGARDFYLVSSSNGWRTLNRPKKIGYETFKVSKCPIDGGDLALNKDYKPVVIYSLDKDIYFTEVGRSAEKIGKGKSPALAVSGNNQYFVWIEGGSIMAKSTNFSGLLGIGNFPKISAFNEGKGAVCIWEMEGKLFFKRI